MLRPTVICKLRWVSNCEIAACVLAVLTHRYSSDDRCHSRFDGHFAGVDGQIIIFGIGYISIIGLLPLVLFFAIRFRTGSDSLDILLFAPGIGLPLLGPCISISDLLFY